MKITATFIQKLRLVVQVFFFIALIAGWHFGIWRILLIPIFVFGVFFCGWVCPFGALQEWVRMIAGKMGIKRYKMPRPYQNYIQMTRYLIFALTLVGITYVALDAQSTFTSNFFAGKVTRIAFIIMGIFILFSIFVDRPFCNYFCHHGARMGLFSVVRFFGIKKEVKCCIHCHKCAQICPLNIDVEKTPFVRHPNCINCFKCINACPKSCLKYRNFPKD